MEKKGKNETKTWKKQPILPARETVRKLLHSCIGEGSRTKREVIHFDTRKGEERKRERELLQVCRLRIA
jgi:hypothetical protein